MASVVETYPAGSNVRVFYDPKNPAEAVLDPIQNTGSRQLVLYASGDGHARAVYRHRRRLLAVPLITT